MANPTNNQPGLEFLVADGENELGNDNLLVRSNSNSSANYDGRSADGSPLVRRFSHSAHDSRPGGFLRLSSQSYQAVAPAETNSLQRTHSLDPFGNNNLGGGGSGNPWLSVSSSV